MQSNPNNNHLSFSREQQQSQAQISEQQQLLEYHHVQSIQQLLQILINKNKSDTYRKIKSLTFEQIGVSSLKASYQYKKNQLSSSLQAFHQASKSDPKNRNSIKKQISKFITGVERQAELLAEHTYDELITFFETQKNKELCKKIIASKYKSMDVLRTHRIRKKVWTTLLNVNRYQQQNSKFYATLNQLTQKNYKDYFDRVIHADVVRTIHQNDEKFKNKIIGQMERVLSCFARRNPYIGYCQGMNFILNFIITMQFDEEECFWLLTCLLEEITPFTYYTNMSGVATDIYIIGQILKIVQPKLANKLAFLEVDISIFVLEWLVCLYTSTLPFYLLVIVWDLMIIEGSLVLLKVAIILLKYFRQVILEATQFSDFFSRLQKQKSSIRIDEESFLKMFYELYIDPEILEIIRKIIGHQKALQKEQLKQNIVKKVKVSTLWKQFACNIQWPICFQQLKKQKQEDEDIQIWVFKDEAGPRLITDYLPLKHKRIINKTEDIRQPEKRIIIGRIPHICDPTSYEQKQYMNSRGIQLDDFDLGVRRINKNLQGVLNLNLSTSAQFFRRATMNKLAFLSRKFQTKTSD